MAAKSMVCRAVGTLVVSVHSAQAPTEEEWSAYLALCRTVQGRGFQGVLVVTAGGGPNTKQRKTTREVFGEGPVPTAVVSDAHVIRGIVTAFSWFNKGIRAFAFNQGAGLSDALKYLDVEGALADRVLLQLTEMHRELGAP
jgi:hypothetical protein